MGVGRPLRKVATGCLGLVALGVVLLILQGGLSFAVDSVLNPWAHSLTGKPVLPGTWVGRVTSPSGQVRGIFLDLRRSTNSSGRYSSCRTCPRIDGFAKLCGGGADVQSYEVWGGPDRWDGSRFHLRVRLKSEPRPGLQLGAIQGEWSGDALSLSMKFGYRSEKADVYDGSNPDVNAAAKFTMARGSEDDFIAACRQLGARAGK